jgi:hypothetical protein
MDIDYELTETTRPVFRVKTKEKKFPAKFKYFTTPGAAAKYMAWQLIADKHRVYDSDYTVHGIVCECMTENGSSEFWREAEWADCPLHDRRDGYYARLHKRMKARILACLEAQNGNAGG